MGEAAIYLNELSSRHIEPDDLAKKELICQIHTMALATSSEIRQFMVDSSISSAPYYFYLSASLVTCFGILEESIAC